MGSRLSVVAFVSSEKDFSAKLKPASMVLFAVEAALLRGSGGFGGGLEGLQRKDEDLCFPKPNFFVCFLHISTSLGWGWCMIGGLFGEVGEGRMIWSLKTARLDGFQGPVSFSLLVARMEEWDTPVEGALAIWQAALGVVF